VSPLQIATERLLKHHRGTHRARPHTPPPLPMPATIFLPSSKHMLTIISYLTVSRSKSNGRCQCHLPFSKMLRLATRSHSPLTSKLMRSQSSYSSDQASAAALCPLATSCLPLFLPVVSRCVIRHPAHRGQECTLCHYLLPASENMDTGHPSPHRLASTLLPPSSCQLAAALACIQSVMHIIAAAAVVLFYA